MRTLRHIGRFIKHPMVYIELTDLHLTKQDWPVNQNREDAENQDGYQEAVSEVPKVSDSCLTPAKDSQVHKCI